MSGFDGAVTTIIAEASKLKKQGRKFFQTKTQVTEAQGKKSCFCKKDLLIKSSAPIGAEL
jgi:hypothetical protein